MKTLEFVAHGTPKAQPRVRAFKRGNHAGVFDPGTADGWKFTVRAAAKEKWDGVAFSGPLKVHCGFFMPRPKCHMRANGLLRDYAPIFHTQKPDLDNLIKAVWDALTGLGVFTDDCQIAVVTASKRWNSAGWCEVHISEAVV